MRSHGPKRVKKLAETTALVTGGAVRVADDVALAGCFFAACPRYIMGQLLFVDGGATTV